MGGNLNTWGHQSKQMGFYEYGLSPFQQKLFKGFFNPGASKLMKRTGRQLLFIGPPFVLFYGLASWADSKFEQNHRKAGHSSAGGH
ncbi:cytochrome b-c1 complex subunit 8 [Zopfochytrium polystomum]|nr:cytochrome b-c1 complex subunit 8 [Zopfochytrium polystomum]